MKPYLDEEQRDALQELMNISMGQAANALAKLIETRITLSIPNIVSVHPSEFLAIFAHQDEHWFTRQSFLGPIRGEIITLLSKQGCEEIAELLDYPLPLDNIATEELLLELANILAGACMKGFTGQLELNTSLGMPTVFHPKDNSEHAIQWSSTLMMEVAFRIEQSQFDAKVVICLEEHSINSLLERLNALLG